ncbi:enoyl-CoA hydratase/isomerase family protein [Mesoterricola silvestris]|uniref:Crotonase n=1 Tax=Mesoterricola silvestris TaxID=2927979 RepID=A0AA48GNT1_9BACT|nr:enoyl-CoA hydratase-related protein [Mesoterricola silvestris]BDU71237.1 crotonase [Mesoterricola silvestris]
MNDHVRLVIENGIGVVTIDRQEALNALDDGVLAGLEEAFLALGRDPSVRAVILTGAGKAFVAGADIKAMAAFTPVEARAFAQRGQRIFTLIEDYPHPVIAAVNGYALGGGCELAMTCDIRIASEKAKAGQPEVNLGVLPGFGGTQRLARIMGRSAAKYLLFTGEVIGAARGLELGLFNEVVAPENLLPRCMEIAAAIAAKAPVAVSFVKHAVNEGTDGPMAHGLSLEAELFAGTFGTQDQKEGMRAFIDKRPPQFLGK